MGARAWSTNIYLGESGEYKFGLGSLDVWDLRYCRLCLGNIFIVEKQI